MRIYFDDPLEFKEMLDKMEVAHSKKCAYVISKAQQNCDCWNHEIRKSFNLMQRMIDDEKLHE